MLKVLAYSLLLVLGLFTSMLGNVQEHALIVNTITMICLSYIMIEVGLEFNLNKKKLGSYGKDYLVAATTAAFPWIFCTLYFFWYLGADYKEALLIGRFAAPTSAGVLFTMLAAIGLSTTWLFKKARVLAIFDDLDTILLMIPLQILLVGYRLEVFIIIPISLILLFLAYRYLHLVKLPVSNFSIFMYGLILAVTVELIRHNSMVQIEVILPAFVLGCMLFNPHDEENLSSDTLSEEKVPEKGRFGFLLDALVKMTFMFLVGASLPKVDLTAINGWEITFHVVIITILSNLGKMFPIFFYKKEASLKQRLALSIAMFPRGEVGAGVLLLSISYGLSGPAVTIAVFSLALNLIFTGPFIWCVVKLLGSSQPSPQLKHD